MRTRRRVFTGSVLSARVAQWTQRSVIKSIQRGTVTILAAATSGTAAITAVDVANSRLIYLGLTASDTAQTDSTPCRLTLTSATVITGNVNANGAQDRVISFEIIEYWPGVIYTVQRANLTTTGATSGTATITAVDTTKTTIDLLGFSTTSAGSLIGEGHVRLVLTNATTLTATGLSALTRTVSFQVIQWY